MKTLTKKLYEALFLVDSSLAAADWDGINKTIETVLEKAKAEIVSMRKWDERKLAYEIDHKGRGTYILCYFRADGQKIQQIERQVQLSEQIMRVLILCVERQSQEDIEKDTPAMEVEKQKQKAAQERALREKAEEPEPSATVQADTKEPEPSASVQADTEESEPSASVQADTEESEQPAAAQAEVEEIKEPPQSLIDSEPEETEPEEESSPPQADAEEQEKEKEPEID